MDMFPVISMILTALYAADDERQHRKVITGVSGNMSFRSFGRHCCDILSKE